MYLYLYDFDFMVRREGDCCKRKQCGTGLNYRIADGSFFVCYTDYDELDDVLHGLCDDYDFPLICGAHF